MGNILGLIGVGLLIVLICGSIAGLIAMREIGKLRVTIRALQRQIESLMQPGGDAPDRAQQPSMAPVAPISKPMPSSVTAPAKTAPLTPQILTPPVKPSPKLKPTPKPKAKLDLETLLGAKGSVWIGGLALLFGAVFLLRYTIEAGMLTPMMRISVAILMGLVALGLSEWMARRDLKSPVGKALAAKADIPAILAAVGVFTLFGAVYAAHAIYGLLGTMSAFISMAVIAVGAIGLSLRRGPWLAAIGLVGALTVPLLVASVTPSYLGVLAYVAIITGASLWVARRQGWPWLRAAALVGATVWLAILLGKAVGGLQFVLWTAGVIGVTVLIMGDIIRAQRGKHLREWLWLGWGGIAVLTALAMLAGDDLTPFSYGLPFAYLSALIVTAFRGTADRLWPLLPLGGGLFAAIVAPSVLPSNPDVAWPFMIALVALSVIFALVLLSVANRLMKDQGATALTGVGGAIATAMLVGGIHVLTDRTINLDLFAGFCLAGLFGVASILQHRLAVVRGAIWIAALIWMLSSYGFSTDILDLPIISVVLSAGLAATTGLVLFSQTGRDDLWVRLAPILLAGLAGLMAVTAVQDSTTYISTTPVLNELWLYFGLPGGLAAIGAILLRRYREDLASQALLGGAIVFVLLLLVLLIHHAMNGGDLTATPGFEDYAVQLLVAFVAMFGASWLRGGLTDWPKPGAEEWRFIVPALALGASGLSLLVFVVAQLFGFNPLINAGTVIDGHPVFNSLLLGYLVPAVLLGAAALRYSGSRPTAFVRTLGALAGVSWLVWTTSQIRRFASGEIIAMDTVPWGNGELYAVSAVWLLTGIALLLAGMKTGRRDLRLASAGLITLTTLKVFLVDMSALDGAFRAISFIGLGIVLIGIGRLYQTVLTGSKGLKDSDDHEAAAL